MSTVVQDRATADGQEVTIYRFVPFSMILNDTLTTFQIVECLRNDTR